MLSHSQQVSWPTLASQSGNTGLWSNLEGDYDYYEWLAALTRHSRPDVQSHAMQETMA
jgi:hypothetical protein